MSRFWSDIARSLTPYVPGEQPRAQKQVKLNTNEFPFPPSPKVLSVMAETHGDALRLYPDPESVELREGIAEYYGLSNEQVFVGNGSDEVLAHAFLGLLKQDQPILFPDITYSFYPVWCELYGVQYQQVPVTESFQVDAGDYGCDNGGIIIPNPNAPTGIAMGLDAIRDVLAANPDRVVIIDEAYVDFGAASAVSLIDEYDNLLVTQTLSKSRALAGLRVGVAMGQAPLIEGLSRVKNSFNSYPLGVLAQRMALAAFEDEGYFRETCGQVIETRERLSASLVELGFEVLPSSANFVFARHPSHSGRQVFERLREKDVIVRFFDKPRISEYLRITVGTEEQCDALLVALKEIL
ncbi:MAG: histidinol-phosphate transaminase [Halieaceae bacterium]